MNRIITVGREFGSGGRELGKRLAEQLQYAYYDREIIEEISRRTQLAEEYVNRIVEGNPQVFFPITVGRTLHVPSQDYMQKQYNSVYAEQANVLRDMALKSDCVIVGRCADYILKDCHPIRLFVYADLTAKMKRCREKADENEHLSDRDLVKKIRSVDKTRERYYQYYTGQKWGNRTNYDISVNTTAIPVKELAAALAHLMTEIEK